jgi:putative membrane protein
LEEEDGKYNMNKEIKSRMYYLRLFLIGAVMGIANIIPGVSGGTMAVVFGIYEELMEALAKFIKDKQNRLYYILFLVVLFSGALFSILAFSKALGWAFDNYELMTVYFFMGLILGSIPVIIKTHDEMRINTPRIIFLILGVGIVVVLDLSQHGSGTQSQIFDYTRYNMWDYIYLVFCGMIAASAMIVPGLSGSFILLMLGVYRTVLDSISGITDLLFSRGFSPEARVRVYIIVSLGIGIVIGILGFARFMSWALKHYPAVTMYLILGLLVGSIYQIFPGYEFDLNGFGAVVTFIIGVILALRFGAESKTSA